MSAAPRPTLVEPRKAEDIQKIQKSGSLVAKEAGGTTVADFFEINRDAIKAVLPQHMTPDRMLKIALRALRTTPKLMNCTINSLFGSVITCAQLGLEPNTPQGHIYLIPFENKRKGVTEVQVIVGYKGLIDLARRSGEIVSISSHAVYRGDKDHFEVSFGTEESIIHKPNLDGDRGDIIGFYAVAKLVGGGTQFEFMSANDVNKIRDGSQGYKTALRFDKKDTPWITAYEEMGRKTVIRRLCKYLPMSIELANAVALEGRAERNEAQGLDQVLNGEFSVLPDDAPQDEYDEETGEIRDGEDRAGTKAIENKPDVAMGQAVGKKKADKVAAKPAAEPETASGAAESQQSEPATDDGGHAGAGATEPDGRPSPSNLFDEE